MDKTPTVTHRDIAREAGVSVAAVSHAFKGNRHVSEKTREHILLTAERMGYRPNAMVNALMERVRSGRVVSQQLPLAVLDVDGALAHMERYPYFQQVLEGMRHKAEACGYYIEPFSFTNEEQEFEKISKILKYRAIRGVIIPAVESISPITNFDADEFASVAVGYSAMVQGHPSRVAPDQFGNTQMAVQVMRQKGYRRIGMYESVDGDLKCSRHFTSAFLKMMAEDPVFDRLQDCLLVTSRINDSEEFVGWVRSNRIEAVLSRTPHAEKMLRDGGLQMPDDVGVALTARTPDLNDFAGIDQRGEVVGAAAISILVSQLNQNETSSSELATSTVVPGVWRDGPTLPDRNRAKSPN